MKLLLAVIFCTVSLTSIAQIPRDPKQVYAFRKLNPCPDGPDTGSTVRCTGYVIDHKKPLCAGGEDSPSNMRYMKKEESYTKDIIERFICSMLKRWSEEN